MKRGLELQERRKGIEQAAIVELQQKGEAAFQLSAQDASAMFHRVVELLFDEQRQLHKILYLADITVGVPDIRFEGRKIFIECEVVLSRPVQITFFCSYSLKNSKKSGELEINSFDRMRVVLGGNKLKKSIARKLLHHFDVVGTTKALLQDLNEVLRRILMTDHGEHCNLESVQMRVLSHALLVELQSKN